MILLKKKHGQIKIIFDKCCVNRQTLFLVVDFDWKKELMLNRLWPALFLWPFLVVCIKRYWDIPKF
jgi:hypothetical protein